MVEDLSVSKSNADFEILDPALDVCHRLKCMPSNSPHPKFLCSSSECDHIGRQDLFRGNHVKMRSARLALTQHTWCPYKNKCGDTYTERMPCEHTERQPSIN